uniref:Putative leucine-rich repeat-containing protein 58 n=1 Tax=Xenopsylla cheopis TaxID=163159 RepID=A0A6M2DKH5_XENCH
MENYTSDSSDSDNIEEHTIDLSYFIINNTHVEENLVHQSEKTLGLIRIIKLNHNNLHITPAAVTRYSNLKVLDLSNNCLTSLPDILQHCPLDKLIVKNNNITNEGLPKTFTRTSVLKELNLSGNRLSSFPEQLLELKELKYLYLGVNEIPSISKDIWRLDNLNILSMGGNRLTEVPDSVGLLKHLKALILSDNIISNLPSSIANLKHLKTLSLHKNQLRTLPTEIITLKCLSELSLRDNPLVVRFVHDMTLAPASLRELSARVVKINRISCGPQDLPKTLLEYLDSGHCCVNPKCQGVFFDNRVEHVKFVDFCGKYRVPLLQYLCSARCITESSTTNGGNYGNDVLYNEGEPRPSPDLMRKVLLG